MINQANTATHEHSDGTHTHAHTQMISYKKISEPCSHLSIHLNLLYSNAIILKFIHKGRGGLSYEIKT